MAPAEHDVDDLLDLAIEAMDRDNWPAAVRFAEEALALRPADADAAALLQLAQLRSRRRDRQHGSYGRRHLTIVFADIVGSTELSGQLDPEVLREVLAA